MRRAAASAAAAGLAALALGACGSAYNDPTAMTCARLAHDARARMLMTDAIDNRLHARSMMPLKPLPTPQIITAEIAQHCAVSHAPRTDRPYGEALRALGGS